MRIRSYTLYRSLITDHLSPFLLFFFFLFSFFSASAQRTLVIYGKLTDAETSQEVASAPVSIENASNKTLSNRHGNYYLVVTFQKGKDVTVVVKDIRYDLKKQKISAKKIEKSTTDSIRVDFKLE
ncbi:MAG: hypothetical protein ACHQF2_09825, partial [Flavobacteriales bacterium]